MRKKNEHFSDPSLYQRYKKKLKNHTERERKKQLHRLTRHRRTAFNDASRKQNKKMQQAPPQRDGLQIRRFTHNILQMSLTIFEPISSQLI